MAAMMIAVSLPVYAFAGESTPSATPAVSGTENTEAVVRHVVKSPKPPYKESQFEILYNKDKSTIKGMPVVDATTGQKIEKPIKFVFWNATRQTYETTVTSANGVLPDVQVFNDNSYIVYAEDQEYDFDNNAYIIWSTEHNGLINDRSKNASNPDAVTKFALTKKAKPTEKAEQNRVTTEFTCFCWYGGDFEDDGYDWAEANATLVFTSPFDKVEVPLKSNYVKVDLLEDMAYVVSVKSDTIGTFPYPVVVKDHSERNNPKLPYNHMSCAPKSEIYFYEKGDKTFKVSKYLGTLTSVSGKTTVEGWNFDPRKLPWPSQKQDTPRYALNEKSVDKNIAKGFAGDFDVLDIHTVNMARIERSKLQLSDFSDPFKITTAIPEGKTVKKVSYIDDEGKVVPLEFTQTNDNKIKFDMRSLSVHPVIIQYGTNDTNITFKNVAGDGSSWEKGSKDALDFTYATEGAAEDKSEALFSGLEVDGKALDASAYSYAGPNLKVSLPAAYLETLAEGKHTVKALFNAGTASVSSEFTVTKKEVINDDNTGTTGNDHPGTVDNGKTSDKSKSAAKNSTAVNTGDNSGIFMYMGILAAAAALLAAYALRKKNLLNEK